MNPLFQALATQNSPNKGMNPHLGMLGQGNETSGAVQGAPGNTGPANALLRDAAPAPKTTTQGAGKSQLYSALKPSQLDKVYNVR